MSGFTKEDLKALSAPFGKDDLGVKIQSLSRDKTKAMLVLYLQHTTIMNRLEEVDPNWTTEVLNEERVGDTVYVRMRMTLKGIARENVGEGGDPKSAYSDALKRCAMLFGPSRYLYDSETVWVAYNEANDRYRAWTYDDYKKALKGDQRGVPLAQAEEGRAASVGGWSQAEKAAAAPRTVKKPEPVEPAYHQGAEPGPKIRTKIKGADRDRSRDEINRTLMGLYRPYLTQYPETSFVQLLHERYGVGETRLMTIEQCNDLVRFMEARLSETVK